MASEPNEPWASAMIKQGLVKSGERPSFRRLAEAAQHVTGTTTPTVQTVINITTARTANPSDEIVEALAQALHVTATTVATWVGLSRELNEAYEPPDGSARLTRRQRDAVDHIIRVMIDSEDHHGNTAPNTRAGESPAQEEPTKPARRVQAKGGPVKPAAPKLRPLAAPEDQ